MSGISTRKLDYLRHYKEDFPGRYEIVNFKKFLETKLVNDTLAEAEDLKPLTESELEELKAICGKDNKNYG